MATAPKKRTKPTTRIINLAKFEEACKHCKFFLSNVTDEYGFCRRFPPVVIGREDGDQESIQPTVTDNEYCGEFKPKN